MATSTSWSWMPMGEIRRDWCRVATIRRPHGLPTANGSHSPGTSRLCPAFTWSGRTGRSCAEWWRPARVSPREWPGGRRLFAVSAVCGATDSHALTQTAGQWAYPAWSEGGRLAVTFYPDTYVFDVRDTNGTITLENPVNLTSEGPLAGYEEGQPSWTPDGTELLVGAGPIGPWLDEDLWVISAGTPGIATQLTHTPESIEFRVTWSPDRTTIAFGDTRDLYTAAISQPWTVGTPALLLDSRYNVRSPSWRPVP